MALEYYDGFDDLSAAQLTRYWNSFNNLSGSTYQSISVNASIVTGRNSTKALLTSGGAPGISPSGGNQATRTVGAAFNIVSISGTTAIITFGDAGTLQVSVAFNSNGTIAVYRGSTFGTLLGTSTYALKTGGWYYVEVTAVINNTTGSVVINVNGGQVLSLAAQNTRNTANNYSNFVTVGAIGTGANVQIDDVYIRDDSTMLGDVRAFSSFANNVGTDTNLTKGGTTINTFNYQQINENLPGADDDTSYVYATTSNVNQNEEYQFQPVASATGTIHGVMVCPQMRNDSAGLMTAKVVYLVGGNYFFGPGSNIGSSYLAYPDLTVVSPATGVAWTISEINSSQFGIVRTA